MRELKGDLQGQGLHVGIVVARFNEHVTQPLLEGAKASLASHGVGDDDITIVRVPGCFELPLTAKVLAQSGSYDAIICLGAVVRGETTHYDLVSTQAAHGIGAASLETGVPITFGVLATDNMDQAINRAGGKMGNAGYNSAVAAIEMARLLKVVRASKT